LQQSGQWGAVQVIPAKTDSLDLHVEGEVLESNGQFLGLKIEVIDATGNTWFSRRYRAEANRFAYSGNRPGEKDAFQDLYNRIANDIAHYRKNLHPRQIGNIRNVSRLKFAESFAPDAFNGYLSANDKGVISIKRLPSDDDPMMARLLKIREREYMFIDTLNGHYDKFYNEMWPSYENWRNLNMIEIKAMKKIKKDALYRQIIGALLIAGAVAVGSHDSSAVGALQTGMIIIGGQVIIDGFNISKEAEIHEAAINELGESFGREMKPVVMEFEGEQYELTGSAEEQFDRWRELLRQIYFSETGFGSGNYPEEPKSDQSEGL
jgi:hypothetical protein